MNAKVANANQRTSGTAQSATPSPTRRSVKARTVRIGRTHARGKVEPARRAVAHQPLAGDEVGDPGGDELDARQHRIERRREGVGGADRGRADDHDTPAHRRAGVGVGVEDRLGAHRRDGAARTVEAQRQMVAEIDARPRLADADGVGFELRLGPRRDRGRAQDEGRQEVGARRDQQRHVARRAGVIGRDVDEADRGRPGERRDRPEDALGNRQRRRAAAAEARLSEGIGAREERRGADHRRLERSAAASSASASPGPRSRNSMSSATAFAPSSASRRTILASKARGSG